MEHQDSGSHLLFSTENGCVHHCAHQDVLVLHYQGYWMALTRPQYRDLHARLIQSARCPLGQMRLNGGGRFAFRSADGGEAFALGREGMEDLLWLLDSARFMLEAAEAAKAGFHGTPK